MVDVASKIVVIITALMVVMSVATGIEVNEGLSAASQLAMWISISSLLF